MAEKNTDKKGNEPAVTAADNLHIVPKDVAEAKTEGSLDLGYAVLQKEDPKRPEVEKAIAAAQAWTLPNPHPQDHRYTLPARAQLLRDLGNLLNTLPEKAEK